MTFLKFKIWFTVIAPKSTMCKVSHTRPMGGIYSLNKEFQMFYMTLTLVAYTWKLHWRSLQTLYLKMGKLWASLNQGERKYCKVESLTWRKHWRIWRMILYISPNFYLSFKKHNLYRYLIDFVSFCASQSTCFAPCCSMVHEHWGTILSPVYVSPS